MKELSPEQQIYEIRQEFFDEAQAFARHRSDIEDEIALNHINALLDAYFELTVEVCYEGKSDE